MKRNPASGTGLVFRFSIRQMCGSKGWLISTLAIALLLLLGIPLLMLAVVSAADNAKQKDEKAVIRTVLICDETEGAADYTVFGTAEEYPDITYQTAENMDAAIAAIEDADSTLILRVTKSEASYLLTVYLPDDSALSRTQASKFGSFAEQYFPAILMQKAALTPDAVMLLSMPVGTQTAVLTEDGSNADEENDFMEMLIIFLVPFIMMMLLYMMVVFYGQSMANSVMLEKTSKLIETILTAVHPIALMAGKLLATACAAVLQILIWLFALTGGSVAGTLIALRMMPDTQNEMVLAVNEVVESRDLFSVSGILVTLVMIALGFLLYLSLAAVAGALAAKSEDLNKTNVVFVLVLVVSMLLCLGSPTAGSSDMSFLSDAVWLNYFPFTSLLLVPAKLLVGKISAGMAVGSLLCLAASVVLFVVIAAVIYKLLVLYRGNPPTPAKLLQMLRQQKTAPDQQDQQ